MKASGSSITRNTDGTLAYTNDGLKDLLIKLVERTGGFERDGKVIVKPILKNRGPEHVWIPDADAVVKKRGELKDPYLSGLVKGEKTTNVETSQYTILAKNKTDPIDIGVLADGLERYGGLRRAFDPKKGMEDDAFDEHEAQHGVELDEYEWAHNGRDRPRVRDLAVFNAERTALHWTSILATLFVKTDVEMPDLKKSDSRDFADWVDKRDANYVDQVNRLYYQLFGIDRSLKRELEGSDVKVWEGAEERLKAIENIWQEQRNNIKAHIGATLSALLQDENTVSGSFFTEEEINKIKLAIKNTKERRDLEGTFINDGVSNSELQAIIEPWISNEIFNIRMNAAVSEKMEAYFAVQIFRSNEYQKKEYVPADTRENYALTGGSATGKSLPMSLVTEKLAKGIAPNNGVKWKKGIDLNDVVHIKSEVMRSLLLESELLERGNRLFMDESAHEERSLIRDKLFHYIGKMNSKQADSRLVAEGTGPVIIHDRRSLQSAHRKALTRDGAPLNVYYYNVPPKEALRRNHYRGTSDLLKLMDEKRRHEIDPETYAPRFVNGRNNMLSQRTAASRALELITGEKHNAVTLGYYSTDVAYGNPPDLFCLVECDEMVMKIHDIPRLLSMADSTNFSIDAKTQHEVGPLPGTLGDYAKVPRKYQALDVLELEPAAGKTRGKERQKANASKLADLFAGYANAGYQVQISTAPREDRDDIPDNKLYAVLSPPVSQGDKPRLTIMRTETYRKKREPHDKGSQRHDNFFAALEGLVEMREVKHSRGDQMLLNSAADKIITEVNRDIERTWADKIRSAIEQSLEQSHGKN